MDRFEELLQNAVLATVRACARCAVGDNVAMCSRRRVILQRVGPESIGASDSIVEEREGEGEDGGDDEGGGGDVAAVAAQSPGSSKNFTKEFVKTSGAPTFHEVLRQKRMSKVALARGSIEEERE
jgi:hypothetical protein